MKVFLSSTYNDLIEHRQAAHDALEQLGLHVIWMEAFGARPVESTKACLEEVDDMRIVRRHLRASLRIYPRGKDISITEQEFDHAQKLGKPIFGFIVNEDHPWSPKQSNMTKKTNSTPFKQSQETAR